MKYQWTSSVTNIKAGPGLDQLVNRRMDLTQTLLRRKGLQWFVLVSSGLYWFVLVSSGLYWFGLVSSGLYWFGLTEVDTMSTTSSHQFNYNHLLCITRTR